MTVWQISAWRLFLAGGPVMWPILLCSVLAVAIILERLMYFAAMASDTHQLKQKVFDALKANNIKEALSLCEADRSLLARILKAGVIKFGASLDEIKESIENASLSEIPKLERKLGALATIAHITPLLGLLGTVIGIAGSFYTIQTRSASLYSLTPADLAGGIWEALLTTIAGLLVAIPAFIAYNYLVSRVNIFVLELERGATELISLLAQLSESKTLRKGSYKGEI